MFCPECKAEYRAGFTRCSDCDVALVDASTAAAAASMQEVLVDSNARELFWSGYDPRIFQQFQTALGAAGIRFKDAPPNPQLLVESMRPMEIWTYLSDHDVADNVYRELTGTGDPREEPESQATIEASEASVTDGASPEQSNNVDSSASDDIAEEISSEDATAEAWVGDSSMLEILEACLRENGIASVTMGEGQSVRILVLPENAGRAKEIVREVVEGTPPE